MAESKKDESDSSSSSSSSSLSSSSSSSFIPGVKLKEDQFKAANDVLNYAERHELLKDKKGNYYRRVMDGDQKTLTWKRAGHIHELVRICMEYSSSTPINESDMNIVSKYICESSDLRLRFINKDKRLFTFSNGVYFASRDEFLVRTNPKLVKMIEENQLVAAKYNSQYERDMNDDSSPPIKDWRNINDGPLDDLLRSQHFPDSTMTWMSLILGRLLFNN